MRPYFLRKLVWPGGRAAYPPYGGIRVFPWIFRVLPGGKLYNQRMKSVFPRLRGVVTPAPFNRRSVGGRTVRSRVLRFVPVNCTSLSLPYMGVTPASDNGGPVSIDQPEVIL